MASLRLRWSEQEAAKAYARPFMVMFLDDHDELIGSVALNGADLLYQRQFDIAVAALAGELFAMPGVSSSGDPQAAWLDHLARLLPAADVGRITPRSTFGADHGRVFAFTAACGGARTAVVDARTLLDYQEFQAAVAHQAGQLLRVAEVEDADQPPAQRAAWDAWLRERVERPGPDDAMSPSWPWR